MCYLLFVRFVSFRPYPSIDHRIDRIISVMDGTLPRKPCKTCKNRFHAGCLYKVRFISCTNITSITTSFFSGSTRVTRQVALFVVRTFFRNYLYSNCTPVMYFVFVNRDPPRLLL